jgi:hypothetical protein
MNYKDQLTENNQLYHWILNTIQSETPQEAAKTILFGFARHLEQKAIDAEEQEILKEEGVISPIFRRVG